eukprot:9249388-Lingulodinium_polyedra.AAC.1
MLGTRGLKTTRSDSDPVRSAPSPPPGKRAVAAAAPPNGGPTRLRPRCARAANGRPQTPASRPPSSRRSPWRCR